jgi:hypothetical protein
MRIWRTVALAAILGGVGAAGSFGQSQAPAQKQDDAAGQKKDQAQTPAAAPVLPEANPADVKSQDAIMAAVYDVISGPAGKRDWKRMNSLFWPGARLMAVRKKKDGSGLELGSYSVQEYSERAGAYFLEHGFFEREIARKTEKWADIAQVFSTYESRHEKDGAPFARGINSMQLFYDGTRWWILTIYWEEESDKNPLPAEFLPAAH